jgi:hypothetical protein
MGWFRSNVRFGAWCALAALALQFALLFGHVHLDGIESHPAGAPGWSAQAPADEPADHPEPQTDRHFCVVCRLIHLADAMAPAASPPLPLPIVASPARLATGIDCEPAGSRPLPFHARAPPIA